MNRYETHIYVLRMSMFFYLIYNAFSFIVAKLLALSEKEFYILFAIFMMNFGKKSEDSYLKTHPDFKDIPFLRIVILDLILIQFVFLFATEMITRKIYTNDLVLYLLFNTLFIIFLEWFLAKNLFRELEENKETDNSWLSVYFEQSPSKLRNFAWGQSSQPPLTIIFLCGILGVEVKVWARTKKAPKLAMFLQRRFWLSAKSAKRSL